MFLLVFETIKVRSLACPCQILTSHANEGAGEMGLAGSNALIRKNARVKLLRQPAPAIVHSFGAIGEAHSFVVHFDAQVNGLASGNRNERCEGIGLRQVRDAGHHAEMLADGFVVRHVKVMELGAVVVADKSGEMLKMFRLEFDDRGGAEAVRLLTARNE